MEVGVKLSGFQGDGGRKTHQEIHPHVTLFEDSG